ncbi:Alpha/beta superfamily hydrolase [Thermoanaerobacterium thermosaccharolyticum]|uniref:Alpha/beta superfamily hydrolase n=1 Tax=Thermoanaerobacterium thermosaccharolyticum TaxID=1517 RepID=A0A223HZ34_THETR|nr:alpha/beta hydrolase [Thermoanaerobacterium thermosaccharolyticum]AST57738.1 Alpha/beta superfamily hydrolase [Thermoanaerobacterium thermosaccharolyticum]
MSMGGVVASILAARRKNNIKALCLRAPATVLVDDIKAGKIQDAIFSLDDLPEFIDFGGLKVGRCFVNDALKLDIYAEASAFDKKVLLLHGDCDKTVPIKYSEKYAELYGENARLIIVHGAKHSFDTIEVRRKFIEITAEFLEDQAKKEV